MPNLSDVPSLFLKLNFYLCSSKFYFIFLIQFFFSFLRKKKTEIELKIYIHIYISLLCSPISKFNFKKYISLLVQFPNLIVENNFYSLFFEFNSKNIIFLVHLLNSIPYIFL